MQVNLFNKYQVYLAFTSNKNTKHQQKYTIIIIIMIGLKKTNQGQ